jgi:BlaI family transcriptional regulator, penicillinase repressor
MARHRSPSLTDAEARLMTVLWDHGPTSVAGIVAALGPKRSVNSSTVQTILRILETKGYVAHEKSGRAFIYRAVVDQRQARRKALKHLVSRLFNNSPSLLVLNALEDTAIDRAELTRLQQLLQQQD